MFAYLPPRRGTPPPVLVGNGKDICSDVELFAVVPRRGVRRTFVCTYPKFTSENGNAFTHARTFPPAIKAQFEEVESPPGGA